MIIKQNIGKSESLKDEGALCMSETVVIFTKVAVFRGVFKIIPQKG